MIDKSRCRMRETQEIPVVTGVTIGAEGVPMVSVLEDGIEKVKPSVGSGTEKFAGFSFGELYSPLSKSCVFSAVVPATGSAVITLPKQNLLATQICVKDLSSGVTLTEGDPGNSNEYSVVDTTGVVTFHTGQAGHTIQAIFRYAPTAAELLLEDNLPNITLTGSELISQIGVILKGTVFTDQYDASKDWAAATSVKLGAGILTNQTGAGATLTCTIVALPSTISPYLGLRF